MYYVLAFIGNARQLTSTCQIIFFNLKNFIFKNFIVPKFCLIFILFFIKKKFPEIFYCLRDCSLVLFIVTVHCYCLPKLQYNLFIAIHFQQCLPTVYCNTIHLPLQYTSFSCNTPSFPLQYNPINYTLKLQYNPCIAIQFFFSHYTLLQYNSSLLQYTYPTYLQASLQYNSLYCNTIFQPNKPSCNTNSCLAIQLPSPQASSCNTIFQANYTPKVAIQCLSLQYNASNYTILL